MDLGTDNSPVADDDAASKAHRAAKTLFDTIDGAPGDDRSMNGPAFGSGIGLAFACDIRFAVESPAVTR